MTSWDYDQGINAYIAELEERVETGEGELREVCARLARAHDTLILVARRAHREGRHGEARWTTCQEWPCDDIGRVITDATRRK